MKDIFYPMQARKFVECTLAAGIVVLAGCHKESVVSATPAADSQSAQPNAPVVVAASSAVVPSNSQAKTNPDMSSTLNHMTQALRKYSFENKKIPASISELQAAGDLGQLPAPPSGKKFAIDSKTMRVILVNQ